MYKVFRDTVTSGRPLLVIAKSMFFCLGVTFFITVLIQSFTSGWYHPPFYTEREAEMYMMGAGHFGGVLFGGWLIGSVALHFLREVFEMGKEFRVMWGQGGQKHIALSLFGSVVCAYVFWAFARWWVFS